MAGVRYSNASQWTAGGAAFPLAGASSVARMPPLNLSGLRDIASGSS